MTAIQAINGYLTQQVAMHARTMEWQTSPSGAVWRKRLHLVGSAEAGQGVVFQFGRCSFYIARPNSNRFIYNPMMRSCMTREREKHSVLREKRFKRVRNVRCLRSIFCIV